MRLDSLTLNVPASAGNGTAQVVRDLIGLYVQVGGTFVADLNIEVSLNDGTDFEPSVQGVTSKGIFIIPEPATHVRVALVALTSGTPTVVVNGRNARTDV
jgi:hypothetical protein